MMKTYLILHGGAGPQSVAAFAEMLAAETGARVLAPTHPGFDGTERPEHIGTVRALAAYYREQIEELEDVTVIGNSIGGWIAAELALLNPPNVRRVVLVDAVGIEVAGHPVADFFSMTPEQVAAASYYRPGTFRVDPAKMAGNRAALAVYAGEPSMVDPTLRERLGAVQVPALVVWGDSDGIADAGYGRALAEAIPSARFVVLPRTGHLPQIESPEALLEVVRGWVADAPKATHPRTVYQTPEESF
ncbi:alpha/beta fold hydrolase [Dactylosporangium sp. CA-139066]|uniref:alpha/beta fold hydrolase n=1 Tax=Dactylosporangium sp. CA-139066 TaxID=3239930 RepID=UPI003D8A0917